MNRNFDMAELETMEYIAQYLWGTGGGAQAKAVIKAINVIKEAPGMLDESNRATALYHLAVALAGEAHAVDTILATAGLFGQD